MKQLAFGGLTAGSSINSCPSSKLFAVIITILLLPYTCRFKILSATLIRPCIMLLAKFRVVSEVLPPLGIDRFAIISVFLPYRGAILYLVPR